MPRHAAQEIIASMKNEGLLFKIFDLKNEGDYTVDDADWNYKDVPHLTHVHKLVDGYPSWMSDTAVATLVIQKVMGFKLPLTLFNYESGPRRQTYHTSFLCFVLIIETTFEELAPIRTRVNTRYHVGGPGWAVRLGFPFIRWALTRNYEDLMSGDIPMRARRGQMRRWGYRFIKRKPTYSFPDTMKIGETNVVPPQGREWAPVEFALADVPETGCHKVGEADHYGLQLHRHGNEVDVFPRSCPHEGSSLDDTHRTGGTRAEVVCPWHARKFAAMATLPVNGHGRFETEFHEFHVEMGRVKIVCKATPAQVRSVDETDASKAKKIQQG